MMIVYSLLLLHLYQNSTPVIEKSLPRFFTVFETPSAAVPREIFSFLDKVGSNPHDYRFPMTID